MRQTRRTLIAAALTALVVASSADGATALRSESNPHLRLLTTGLQGGGGSTLGPDGALYVTEAVAGKVSRIDRRTGKTTTFASGLPARVIALGGAMDVAFLRHTAYVLVTLVGPDVGGSNIVGIYRVDGPHTFTVVADLGAYSIAHPPTTDFAVPTGVQFAMQPYRDGFLVTDGHHNRVLYVTRSGHISEVATFDNIVPTGLAIRDGRVLMAEAGPVPHLPEDGKIVTLSPRSHTARELASGAPLLVDVEAGPHHGLYALAQGHFTPGGEAGTPADPRTGSLNRVQRDGSLHRVVGALDQPTSLEIVGTNAYIVTLTGQVWTVDNLSS